ncbi:hypothetical protein, partial [Streptomyces sp. NPDC127574]
VRGARIGAEKAAETARRQVQDQASIDHEHWLRQQRIEAYSEFLTVYDDATVVASRTRKKVVDMEPNSVQPEEDLRELKEILHRLRQVRQRVKLVGPEPIHMRATALEDSVQDYCIDLELVADAKASGDPDTPQMFEQEYRGMRASANAHDAFVRAIGVLIEGRPVDDQPGQPPTA